MEPGLGSDLQYDFGELIDINHTSGISDAKVQIKNIAQSAEIFYQENQDWPADCWEEMNAQGYLDIKTSTTKKPFCTWNGDSGTKKKITDACNIYFSLLFFQRLYPQRKYFNSTSRTNPKTIGIR